MKDILDYNKKKTRRKSSKISFRCFFLTLVAMFLLNFSTTIKSKLNLSSELFDLMNALSGLVLFGSMLVGIFEGINSIRKKEKNDYEKVIGILGNGIILALLIHGLFLMANGHTPK